MVAQQRQRRTFGCVQRMRKGVYRLRWIDAGRRRSETVYGSRHDAERRLAEIQTATDERRPSMQTVGEIWQALARPELERTSAASTMRNNASAWERHVSQRWASTYADEVRAADFQAWLLTIPRGSANISIGIMRLIMRHAVMLGLIDRSPLDMRFEKPQKSGAVSHEIIAAADIDAYHAAVRGTLAEVPFLLGACAGLRVGEMLGVRVGEIEMAGGMAVFEVCREVDEFGRIVLDRDGTERVKTRMSRRWAVVYEPYASRLMELQAIAEASGDVYLADDGTGNPIGKRSLRKAWERALDAAGLPMILLRNLRPSFATSMHASYGMLTEDIARLMGHTKPVITFGTYQRPGKDAILDAAARSAPNLR